MKRSKQKKQLRMEEQDAKGISRKKWNHTISLRLFVILKLVCIVSIPVVYFVYSPLLILCMLCYVGLFFLAIMAERRINTSIIKSNHIKIPKLDSALALILIVVAIFGSVMSSTSKTKESNFKNVPNFKFEQNMEMDFAKIKRQSWWNSVVSDLKTFGSILTGERSIFEGGKQEFGRTGPPKDFVIDKNNIPEKPIGDMPEGDFPGMGGGNFDMSNFPKRPNFEFSMNDVPVEYMFSSIATTIITVLIFSVSGCGLISLLVLYIKKRKFERVINEVILEEQVILTDEEIERLLDFGEPVGSLPKDNSSDKQKTEPTKDIIRTRKKDKSQVKNKNKEVEELSANPEENIEILKDDFNIESILDE